MAATRATRAAIRCTHTTGRLLLSLHGRDGPNHQMAPAPERSSSRAQTDGSVDAVSLSAPARRREGVCTSFVFACTTFGPQHFTSDIREVPRHIRPRSDVSSMLTCQLVTAVRTCLGPVYPHIHVAGPLGPRRSGSTGVSRASSRPIRRVSCQVPSQASGMTAGPILAHGLWQREVMASDERQRPM